MSVLEAAMEELKALPPHKLVEAVQYIHALHEASHAERLAALEQSGGVLSSEDAEAMERTLTDCRQIDAHEW